MPVYTEFHFNAELKSSTPQEVINTLKYMIGVTTKEPKKENLPNHDLFKMQCWSYMLHQVYPSELCTLKYNKIRNKCYYLSIKTKIKNYTGCIPVFLSWIAPYLNKQIGGFLGFHRYEESEVPYLLWMGKNKEIVQRKRDLIEGRNI